MGTECKERSEQAGKVGIRERILAEAMRLFSHNGFAATSIRHITRAARVTNPMIYYYFGSKEELFQAILREAMDTMAEAMLASVRPEMPLREKLITVLALQYEMVCAKPELARMFFLALFGPQRERFAPSLQEQTCKLDGFFQAMLEEAMVSGELRRLDPELVGMHLGGLFHSPILGFLAGDPVELTRSTAEALVDQFLMGVGGVARRASEEKGESP